MAEAEDKHEELLVKQMPELPEKQLLANSDAASTISSSYSDISTDTAMTTDSSGKVVRRKKKLKKTTTDLGGVSVETIRWSKKKRASKKGKNMVANWANVDFGTWRCLGGGPLGISELQKAIDENNDQCLFGMVQIKIGSGRFEKCKNMFIEFNGVNCRPMTRMTAGTKRDEAHKLVGQTHAQIVFEKREEVNIRNVFAQIGHLFVAENIVGAKSVFSTETVTVEEIEKQYERQMAKKAAEYLEAQRKLQAERPVVPPKIDRIQEILSLFHEDMGWVNWVLFKATQKKLKLLHEESFGSGTIFALRQSLVDDDVLFGLLRLSFGEMPYRRTHFVLLHWVGPKTKRVKRGKLNARADRMAKMLTPWGIKLELKGAEEITIANIIHRVRNIVVVDGDAEDPEEVIEQKLIEEFNRALEQEENANKNTDRTLKADKEPMEVVGSPVADQKRSPGGRSPNTSTKDDVKRVETTITETITLVQSRDAEINWILLQPTKKKKKRKGKKKKKAFVLGS